MKKQDTWLQLVCHTCRDNSEAIEAVMEDAGALSITLQDAKDEPVLEPLPGEIPLWKELIIIALFNENTDLGALTQTLKDNKNKWNISKLHTETLQDQDWERVWMKDFHPMRFGDNLWIYPSNYETPDDDSVKIHLDPGLAFGTGTHPTTALCLEWLDQHPPKGLKVVDYGCGSGILAVVAAKLGAKHIYAIDIDPQGLIATKDNMQRNSIKSSRISCYLPDDFSSEPSDLVLANILCGPLLELYPLLSSLIRSESTLVLSGILEDQTNQVIDKYVSGFKDFKIQILDGWARISATKI
ncbi:MAG TPA: 50S ribosomal protein L11 methyltransferase [Leucothrix sp.]|nr:50S ribosomal protein L11 methyltransferase [Leucothrix sp.]